MSHGMPTDVPLVGGVLTVVVAALHLYFLYLEMFRWEAPRTRKIFRTTPEFATASRALAANQGLYNGFLSVGLLFGLMAANEHMVLFLLACVVVAGIYGAITATRTAFYVQSVPALLAFLAFGAGI